MVLCPKFHDENNVKEEEWNLRIMDYDMMLLSLVCLLALKSKSWVFLCIVQLRLFKPIYTHTPNADGPEKLHLPETQLRTTAKKHDLTSDFKVTRYSMPIGDQ